MSCYDKKMDRSGMLRGAFARESGTVLLFELLSLVAMAVAVVSLAIHESFAHILPCVVIAIVGLLLANRQRDADLNAKLDALAALWAEPLEDPTNRTGA